MSEEKPKPTKLKSRTFWLAIIWTLFVPASIVCQVLVADMKIAIPIGAIVTSAAALSTIYVGGNKGKQIATAAGAPKGESGKDNEDD